MTAPQTKTPKPRAAALPEVSFSDYGNSRTLHLGSIWVQGSMLLDAPNEIELEYVQRMMAWLLFVEPASVKARHAMQLGLGAASLTKFCRKKIGMKTTAIELNPGVIHACRGWFKLPPNDTKLQVLQADAAQEIQNPRWWGTVDALHVDLYDADAAAPVLDSAAFYADCRRLLTPDGCMAVNLFGRASSYEKSLAKITQAFGVNVNKKGSAEMAGVVSAFKATREGNTVVLARNVLLGNDGLPELPSRAQLALRAENIHTRFGLPAPKWLRAFKLT
ncbi:MAG: spermidine synthase [Burkholderiales bacterium]